MHIALILIANGKADRKSVSNFKIGCMADARAHAAIIGISITRLFG